MSVLLGCELVAAVVVVVCRQNVRGRLIRFCDDKDEEGQAIDSSISISFLF